MEKDNIYLEDKNLFEKLEKLETFTKYLENTSVFLLSILSHFIIDKKEKLNLSKEELQSLIHENTNFFEYFDTAYPEYLDNCLFKDKIPYEVFCFFRTENFLKLADENLLRSILEQKLKVCFIDDYKIIAVLNYNPTISEKIEEILMY